MMDWLFNEITMASLLDTEKNISDAWFSIINKSEVSGYNLLLFSIFPTSGGGKSFSTIVNPEFFNISNPATPLVLDGTDSDGLYLSGSTDTILMYNRMASVHIKIIGILRI